MEIRPEHIEDYDAVYALNNLAFGQANEAKLVDLLRDSDAFIPELSLVAVLDKKIVGHILFSEIQIENEQKKITKSLALAPMAVLPEFQQKGIGSQLITTGLDTAKNLGYKSVIVLGHEQYYPKFGFEPAVKWNIRAPFDVPSNAFMAIELVMDGLKNVNGTVKYPKAFEIV